MAETLMDLYNRTLKKCKYFEKTNRIESLNNEIGCLRGIGYCMEITGGCPHDEDFLHFIALQESLRSNRYYNEEEDVVPARLYEEAKSDVRSLICCLRTIKRECDVDDIAKIYGC